MKTLGIDIGSLTTKVIILDNNGISASSLINSDDEAEVSAKEAIAMALGQADPNLGGNYYIVTTGTGGKSISFNQQHKAVTTCLARGIHHLFPSARMGIDIGAESSTVFKINERGRVKDWANHDKCAAGTGVFLKQMAKLMQLSLDEMSELSFQANSRPEISGTCAVFAESEVISHVHRDPPTPMADIAAGIYYSVVSRIMALCKRVGIEKDVAVTGGVALSNGLVNILEEELGFNVLVPDIAQSVAALGAAIIARENMEKGVQ